MKTNDSDRRNQINDMITIARMGSFLLMGSIICKATVSIPNIRQLLVDDYISLIMIMNPLVILLMLYFIVSFSNVPALKKYRDSKKFHKIELWSQFVLFTIFVFYNGGVKNQFKFIYLFFIIRCTIEIGKSAGTMVSLSSSAIILLMDLFMEQNSNINIFFENDIVLSALFILTAWLLGYYVNEEKEHKSYLQELANKDGVTGTYNHRFFYSFLYDENLWDRNQHNKISMMFIDIDDFKIYNDLFGHLSGDDILKKVSSILMDKVDGKGIVSRYGGDEFAIILPDIGEEEAVTIAESIIKETAVIHKDDDSVFSKITVSIGISVYPDRASNEQELVKSADDALYRAKIFNKNRIETYTFLHTHTACVFFMLFILCK